MGRMHQGSRAPFVRTAAPALLALAGVIAGRPAPAQQPSPAAAPAGEGVAAPPPAPSPAEIDLAAAEALRAAGRHEDALGWYERAIERGSGQVRAQALFGAGEAELALGRHYEAYLRFDRLLREHADFPALGRAIQRSYEIGVAFIEGKARRPWLCWQVRSPALGAEILARLVDNYQENYFDYALLLIGDHHFAEGEWRRAADAYLRLEQEFPDSEWAGTALLRRALCELELSAGYRYDDQPVRRAEQLLLEYLRRYPRGDRVPEARAALGRIAEMRARLYLDNARYYLRNEGRPRAALVYLEAVLRECPLAEAAARAPALLEQVAARARAQGDGAVAERALRLAGELARVRAAAATPSATGTER
ncbi:MAG: hypothetical protein KatS3mg102_1100 [Planctomycetota bacterium]|nr:MAG: hypothetical protein KatS3mg102_1100 [Planctomycetota bacterium]